DHRVWEPLDLDAARAVLAEAGHPDGVGLPRLEMLLTKGLEVLEPGIERALAQIGVGVDFKISERGSRTSQIPADLWLTSWVADYPDPDGFFRGLLTDPCDP